MRKYLSGSAGTGDKIVKNGGIFKYEFLNTEKLNNNQILYHYRWIFDQYQYGFISIKVNKEPYYIDESSIINTDKESPRKFSRPLGLYNDHSMKIVYEEMLRNCKDEYM